MVAVIKIIFAILIAIIMIVGIIENLWRKRNGNNKN